MIRQKPSRSAFTLVEMVIVVVIIGIISAIAVPRIDGASRRAEANALKASVANVRKAIDEYFAEHNSFPGYNPANGSPNGPMFQDQLLKYSNLAGKTSDVKTSVFRFGPYLRAPFPTNPINNKNKVYVKATPTDPDPSLSSHGWIAVLSTGDFGINASDAEVTLIIESGGSTSNAARGALQTQ